MSFSVTLAQALLVFVLLQRMGELWFAKRNTERLMAEGGVEHGAAHYPYIVVMHAAWLTALVILGTDVEELNYFWLAVFAALQAGRFWVLATLGPYFTTRIISVPGAPMVTTGPYRFFRHPNYLVVIGEIAVLPLVFGLWQVAILFSILNAIALRERIRVENEALAERRPVD